MIRERERHVASGLVVLPFLLLLSLGVIWYFVVAVRSHEAWQVVASLLLLTLASMAWMGPWPGVSA